MQLKNGSLLDWLQPAYKGQCDRVNLTRSKARWTLHVAKSNHAANRNPMRASESIEKSTSCKCGHKERSSDILLRKETLLDLSRRSVGSFPCSRKRLDDYDDCFEKALSDSSEVIAYKAAFPACFTSNILSATEVQKECSLPQRVFGPPIADIGALNAIRDHHITNETHEVSTKVRQLAALSIELVDKQAQSLDRKLTIQRNIGPPTA